MMKFSKLKISNIQCIAKISFNTELKDISEWCIPDKNVVGIKSNFAKKYYKGYEPKVIDPNKKRRGRKPEKKKKRKKKTVGTGDSMDSQVTLNVKSDMYKNKVYKIAVFNTGTLKIPGGKRYDLADIKEVIYKMNMFLDEIYHEDIILLWATTVMINYKFMIKGEGKIYLQTMLEIVERMQENDENQNLLNKIDEENLYDNIVYHADNSEVPQYIIDHGEIPLAISSFKYDTETSPPLYIYFKTPIQKIGKNVKKGKEKLTGVKIFNSGKINIIGANNEKTAKRIYKFVIKIIKDNPNVIY